MFLISENCEKMGFILRIVTKLVYYLGIIIPILLIVLITYDLAKVMVSNVDEKVKKDASNKAVKRFIYAIIIFLIPTIFKFIFRTLDDYIKPDDKTGTNTSSWVSCWNYYINEV